MPPPDGPGAADAWDAGPTVAEVGGGRAGSGGNTGTDGGAGSGGSLGGASSGGGGGRGGGRGGSGGALAGSGGDAGVDRVSDAPRDTPGSRPDSPPDEPAALPAGAQCSENAACASGVCADNVCCDKTCAGCMACRQTMTGKPNGTCGPVITGQDFHGACTDETASNQCGNDGTCDGAGACRKVSTSHVCTPASCNGSVYTPVSTCGGAGTCKTVASENCGAFSCTTAGCATACTDQSGCLGTNYCDTANGTCSAKKVNGASATSGYECLSGVVADGVCCNSTCTGCSACTNDLTGGATGQCLPVLAGRVAHSACTASLELCGMDGTCNGAGACRYPVAGTGCGSTCTGSTLTPRICNGVGTCVTDSPQACSDFTVCADDGINCGTLKANGADCTGPSQCANNNCVDNLAGTSKICCVSACGTCNGCTADGTACANKDPGAQDLACDDLAGCLIGTCDGTGACQQSSDNPNCGPNTDAAITD